MRMKIFTLIAFLCSVNILFAQDFTVKTSVNSGTGFKFQIHGDGVTEFYIDWGDGGGKVSQAIKPDPAGKFYTDPSSVTGSRAIKFYSNGVNRILVTGGSSNPIEIDEFTIEGEQSPLVEIQLNECKLGSVIGLSKAPHLEIFRAGFSNLSTLDLQNNPEIEAISMAGSSSLNSIALPVGSKVKDLNLNNTGLTNTSLADILSKAPLLEKIQLNYLNVPKNISTIDFSSNTALKSIAVMNNSLTGELNLTGLNNLEEVTISNNALTSFITSSPALTTLNLNKNELISVDLTGCTSLSGLKCVDNSLTSIDLTTNTALKNVELGENALTSITFASSLSGLDELHVNDNAFNFNTLPRIAVAGTYSYDPQRGVLPISVEPGGLYNTIDMSKYLTAITDGPVPGSIGQESTVVGGFPWVVKNNNDSVLIEYTVLFTKQDGNIYTFNTDLPLWTGLGYSNVVFFKVKNEAFPGLTLETSRVELGQEPVVGINPSEESHNIVSYNPASKEVCYEVEGAQRIFVINLMGQVAYTQALASDKAQIGVDNLAQGVYAIQITTDAGKVITRKIVIK